MPRINRSSSPNMQDWTPMQNATQDSTDKPDSPPDPGTTPDPQTRNPMMNASLPLMATTNDALSQFYSDQNLPWKRILPAHRVSGVR